MAIAPISSSDVVAPASRKVKAHKNAVKRQSENAVQPEKKDTVTISKQAILMNSPNYSPAEEAQESSADKAAEKIKGQR